MPRKRKRNWPITVYKYGLMTDSGITDAWWLEHCLWCKTWNNLVISNKKLNTEYKKIKNDKEKMKIHKEKCKTIFKKIIKDSGLYWTHKEYIEEIFWTTLRNAEGDPRNKSPFKKNICLLHRYTNGGSPLNNIFRKNKRFWIEPIDWKAVDFQLPQRQWKKQVKTKVHFGMCGEEKIFSCVIHRPIYQEAIIKQVKIIGRRYIAPKRDKIKWEVSITVEIPHVMPEKRNFKNKQMLAALELGWRNIYKGILRVGLIKNEFDEIMDIIIPNKIYNSIQKEKELQKKKDDILNNLRLLFEKKINKKSGIKKYFEAVKEIDDKDLNAIAEYQLIQWKKTCALINMLNYHISGYRKWFYYNTAHEICNQYHTIIIKEMDIRQLSQPKKDKETGNKITEARKRAQKYRKLAAIGEFREIIKRVAIKHGTKLIIIPGENTTLKHFECGHIQTSLETEKREKLFIKCQKCRKEYNQDINATDNMLNYFFENKMSLLAEK